MTEQLMQPGTTFLILGLGWIAALVVMLLIVAIRQHGRPDMSMYWAGMIASAPFAAWLAWLVPSMIAPTIAAAVGLYFYTRWICGLGTR